MIDQINAGEIQALWQEVEHCYNNWCLTAEKVNRPLEIKIFGDDSPCCIYSKSRATNCTDHCRSCLVAERTGSALCEATPWPNVSRTLRELKHSNNAKSRSNLSNALEDQYRFFVELAVSC